MSKLDKQIEKLRGSTNGEKYEKSLRRTKNELANMKVKIKNKAEDLLTISNKTGNVRINEYFLYEEKNIDGVERSLRNKVF